MSDSEGETIYEDEAEEDEVSDFAEDEEEEPGGEGEGDQSSFGSGGFRVDEGETPKKESITSNETPLSDDMVRDGISMLCKTGDGLEIAFVKLDVQNKGLTNVSLLSTFLHLRYVNLSDNKLTSLTPLQNLRFLVSLKVAYNEITSMELPHFSFLQVLDLTGNQLKTTATLHQTSLEKLVLAKNQLEDLRDMTTENLPSLAMLDITGNRLKTLDGLESTSLKNLYAASNQIKSLRAIGRLTALERLHLRDNLVRSLASVEEGQENTSVQYLNLRGNPLQAVEELSELRRLRALQTLVLAETPLADEGDDYRIEALVYARRLRRIDKDDVEEVEREEAAELFPQREQERLVEEREGTRRHGDDDESLDAEGEGVEGEAEEAVEAEADEADTGEADAGEANTNEAEAEARDENDN